jgi:phosphatidate phosphatase APP1
MIKVYHGYGHTHDLVLYGHVFKNRPHTGIKKYTDNVFLNIIHLLKLFFVKPFPHVKVRMNWYGRHFYTTTETDGFFKLEWEADEELVKGWHPVTVDCMNENGEVMASDTGQVFVPHSTQFVLVSDIDDTVMVSHSATILKRLRELLIKNPRKRQQFHKLSDYYQRLTLAKTHAGMPNPFFYVSSSEWNLYDYLDEFFTYNQLPRGIFLLSQVKRWFQLLRTGKTKHEGKLMRIARIMHVFPHQQFILLGDNTQSDPVIYTSIAQKFPGRIFAIYIRNVRPEKQAAAASLLASVEPLGIHTCLFNHTAEASLHSNKIGLLD